MGFKRIDFGEGAIATKYVDNNMFICPFCGTHEPNWLADVYIANYSIIQTKNLNGYKFKCSKCGGIFELQANSEQAFKSENFTLVQIIDAGTGVYNLDKVRKPITIHELKEMTIQILSDEEDANYLSNDDNMDDYSVDSGVSEGPVAFNNNSLPSEMASYYSQYEPEEEDDDDYDDDEDFDEEEDTPVVSKSNVPAKEEKNDLAVAGLILAIFIPLAGLIVSGMALSKANKLNGKGRGLAVLGLLISLIYYMFFIISIVYYFNLMSEFLCVSRALLCILL